MAKPSSLPIWATDPGAAIQNPGAAKNALGWVAEIPPHEFFNHWQNLVYQWVSYFDGEIDAVAAQQNNYDAVVGVGGTDADLPAALARVGSQSKILVTADQVLAARVDIDTLTDLVIEFKPGVQITTVDNIPVAFQISNANRVQIIGGRFVGFNNPGDVVFDVQATAKNTAFFQSYFFDNDDEIQDNGLNTEINVINEVA
jgi:hypothetical protein